ncbi:glycosyltransferase family 32 protein [Tessaracoccus sp. Y1736]
MGSPDVRFLGLMRKAKHLTLRASKAAKPMCRQSRDWFTDLSAGVMNRFGDYEFDAARYRRSFLARHPPAVMGPSRLPRQAYCFWTGDNPLSANRLASLDLMRARLDLPVHLVTPADLGEWVVEGHPLHPAYEYLSLVHRSDYLRAYFLHFHGGAYLDIKQPLGSWLQAFEASERDPQGWYRAPRIRSSADVVSLPGRLGRDLRRYHGDTVATHAGIAWSATAFTAEWLREVERRLDAGLEQAREFPGQARGDVVGYPFSWHDLLARVFHPLCLKYRQNLRADERLRLDYDNYL